MLPGKSKNMKILFIDRITSITTNSKAKIKLLINI